LPLSSLLSQISQLKMRLGSLDRRCDHPLSCGTCSPSRWSARKYLVGQIDWSNARAGKRAVHPLPIAVNGVFDPYVLKSCQFRDAAAGYFRHQQNCRRHAFAAADSNTSDAASERRYAVAKSGSWYLFESGRARRQRGHTPQDSTNLCWRASLQRKAEDPTRFAFRSSASRRLCPQKIS
jgi:hypothetical protein